MFCLWERINKNYLNLVFQVLVTNPFISAYLHIVLVVLVSNLLLFDIHLALPYIKTAKGIFHLNYFPPKYSFGELASFRNEVFISKWDCWPALHKASSLVRILQGQKGEWRSLTCFPSAFEINSWHVLNCSTRVTKQEVYFNRLGYVSGRIQWEQGENEIWPLIITKGAWCRWSCTRKWQICYTWFPRPSCSSFSEWRDCFIRFGKQSIYQTMRMSRLESVNSNSSKHSTNRKLWRNPVDFLKS